MLLSDFFIGPPPPGAITYGATNLPPGLSLTPTTGQITGTIPFNSYSSSPYTTLLSTTIGTYTREWTMDWTVLSAISVYIPYFEPLLPQPVRVDETAHVSFDPISVSDGLNRTPIVTVTGLPDGLSFNLNTGVINGTIPVGASAHGPYDVHVHAEDGIETADIAFPMIVSGIQLAFSPLVQLNHNGDAVDFNLNATSSAGGTLAYSASGLPAGITLNATTGQISGTLAANANAQSPYHVELHYDDSYSTKSSTIIWTVLQAGVTDQISTLPVGQQSNTVGDNVALLIQAHSSLLSPLQLSAQGLPPGLTLAYTPDYYFNGYIAVYISGTLPAAAALTSLYQVTVTASDGLYSASTNFQWQVVPPQPPAFLGDFDGNNTVDQTDYGVWRGNFGQSVAPYSLDDGNGDGQVDTADWVVWRKHLGQTLGGGAAIAIPPQETATTEAPLALTSTAISSSLTSLKMPSASEAANESHAMIFEELEFAFPQRLAARAPKHITGSRLAGLSISFLRDNLLMTEYGKLGLGLHCLHQPIETAYTYDIPTEDADVVDQALEEFSMPNDSRRWLL